MADRWILRGESFHCSAHNTDFARAEVCQLCVSDPGDSVDESASVPDPELHALRHEYRSRARTMWRMAQDFAKDPTDREASAACKASAEATKWERLALDVHDKLVNKTELAELLKQYAELLGRDGAAH